MLRTSILKCVWLAINIDYIIDSSFHHNFWNSSPLSIYVLYWFNKDIHGRTFILLKSLSCPNFLCNCRIIQPMITASSSLISQLMLPSHLYTFQWTFQLPLGNITLITHTLFLQRVWNIDVRNDKWIYEPFHSKNAD